MNRCGWCKNDPLMIAYHDEEWGVPVHDDQLLFEFLTLEGAQAGLSWQTILNKRHGYRQAFAGFRPEQVARFNHDDEARLRNNPDIVRNRLKISATVTNARAFLDVQDEFGSFDSYIWRFIDSRPIQNSWRSLKDVPAVTSLAEQISKDLKKRGFRFAGPTICYAFMQAIGMVNDHVTGCFRHAELQNIA